MGARASRLRFRRSYARTMYSIRISDYLQKRLWKGGRIYMRNNRRVYAVYLAQYDSEWWKTSLLFPNRERKEMSPECRKMQRVSEKGIEGE